MKTSFGVFFLTATFSVFAFAADGKDTADLDLTAPEGPTFGAKAPDAPEPVKNVKKTSPNTYEVKVNRGDMKKMEVRINPPPKDNY